MIGTLRRSGIPRRPEPLPASSLAVVDACRLLDPADLAGIAGFDPVPTADPDFGRRGCEWDGDDGTDVEVAFDRDVPFDAEDGPIAVAGREAVVTAEDDGCAVEVLHRSFRDGRGDTRTELIVASVQGASDGAVPCQVAIDLAAAAVARLPAP